LVLWYLFRPERLFINKRVNEPLPGTLLYNPPSHSYLGHPVIASARGHRGGGNVP